MADKPRMPMPRVELSDLLPRAFTAHGERRLGRTKWNWRAPREEGPVPECHAVCEHNVFLVTTCADGHRFIDEEDDHDDKLFQLVHGYMMTAYPRGGRTKSRRN